VLKYFERIKFIKYCEIFNKWLAVIKVTEDYDSRIGCNPDHKIGYDHIIGCYDSREEAINNVLDKLDLVFGKIKRPLNLYEILWTLQHFHKN
jgi:hypothetical protein